MTTHVFVKGDKYLDSDAVFATKESLVGEFKVCTDGALGEQNGMETPFTRLEFNFGLMPQH